MKTIIAISINLSWLFIFCIIGCSSPSTEGQEGQQEQQAENEEQGIRARLGKKIVNGTGFGIIYQDFVDGKGDFRTGYIRVMTRRDRDTAYSYEYILFHEKQNPKFPTDTRNTVYVANFDIHELFITTGDTTIKTEIARKLRDIRPKPDIGKLLPEIEVLLDEIEEEMKGALSHSSRAIDPRPTSLFVDRRNNRTNNMPMSKDKYTWGHLSTTDHIVFRGDTNYHKVTLFLNTLNNEFDKDSIVEYDTTSMRFQGANIDIKVDVKKHEH